jgi:hypothetical protein
MKTSIITTLLGLGSVAIGHSATSIQVEFQGLGNIGFAPVVGAFHSGEVNFFDAGSSASTALETLAEVGNPSQLLGTVPMTAQAGTVTSGPGGAGVSGTVIFSVADGNTLFSYASMLLPTNDWFIGNDNGRDISSLLNAAIGTNLTFDVSTVWDAGTESEDFAFSAGNPLFGIPAGDAGAGDTTSGLITAVTGSDPFAAFANQPGGFDSSTLDFSGSPVGRFTLTVVPEPSAAILGLLGLIPLFRRRR